MIQWEGPQFILCPPGDDQKKEIISLGESISVPCQMPSNARSWETVEQNYVQVNPTFQGHREEGCKVFSALEQLNDMFYNDATTNRRSRSSFPGARNKWKRNVRETPQRFSDPREYRSTYQRKDNDKGNYFREKNVISNTSRQKPELHSFPPTKVKGNDDDEEEYVYVRLPKSMLKKGDHKHSRTSTNFQRTQKITAPPTHKSSHLYIPTDRVESLRQKVNYTETPRHSTMTSTWTNSIIMKDAVDLSSKENQKTERSLPDLLDKIQRIREKRAATQKEKQATKKKTRVPQIEIVSFPVRRSDRNVTSRIRQPNLEDLACMLERTMKLDTNAGPTLGPRTPCRAVRIPCEESCIQHQTEDIKHELSKALTIYRNKAVLQSETQKKIDRLRRKLQSNARMMDEVVARKSNQVLRESNRTLRHDVSERRDDKYAFRTHAFPDPSRNDLHYLPSAVPRQVLTKFNNVSSKSRRINESDFK